MEPWEPRNYLFTGRGYELIAIDGILAWKGDIVKLPEVVGQPDKLRS